MRASGMPRWGAHTELFTRGSLTAADPQTFGGRQVTLYRGPVGRRPREPAFLPRNVYENREEAEAGNAAEREMAER